METTIILGLYRGNIGIMENKMAATIQGLGFRVPHCKHGSMIPE